MDQVLPDKKQTDRDRVIAEALGDIKIYVEHGKSEGFVQVKPPQLTSFRFPTNDGDPSESQDLLERDRVQPTAVDRWNRNQVLQQVNLIQEEDLEYFGKTLTDEVTGEHYMLVPIDVDILINPETLAAGSAKEHQDSQESLEKAEPSTNGYTIHIPQPGKELVGDQVPIGQGGSQYHRHEFRVPKLSLGFQLILATELPESKDSKTDLPSSTTHLSPHTEVEL